MADLVYYLGALILGSLMFGAASARGTWYLLMERQFQSPRYWIVRRLDGDLRPEAERKLDPYGAIAHAEALMQSRHVLVRIYGWLKGWAAWLFLYAFGCPDCTPFYLGASFWLGTWGYFGLIAPVLTLPAGTLGAGMVARIFLQHAGWLGRRGIHPDTGAEIVVGGKDWPEGHAHPPREFGTRTTAA